MSLQTDTPENVELGNVRVNYLESATTLVTDVLVPNTSTADVQVQSAIQVQAQAVAPTAPPAGYANVYPDTTTGTLVSQSSAGTVTSYLGSASGTVPANTLLVGQGTSTLAQLPVGSANQVLAVSNAGTPTWSDTLPSMSGMPLVYSVYNATALTLTGADLPIPFDNFQSSAGLSVFMLTSNDTQLYCSVAGQYFIYVITTIQMTVGTNTSTAAQMFLNNVAVVGTYVGTRHTSTTQTGSSNAMFAVLTLARGDLIEIRARRVLGTGTVTSFVQGNSLLTMQHPSTAQYFFAHSPTAVSQTNTLQTVNFGTVAVTTANYSNASGVVTVGTAGIYLIAAKASFTSVNANDILEEVQILVNNVIQDAGGYCWQGDTGVINSCDMIIVRNLAANDNVRVQTRITSGTSGSSTLQAIGTAVCLFYLGPTTSVTAAGFTSNAATAIGTTATTLTLNTSLFNTSGTAFSLSGNTVTFNESGTYYLFASISAGVTVATAAGSRAWINITSDALTMQMEGTQMLGTHVNVVATGRDHLLTYTSWQAKPGQQVQLQALRTGGATSTIANGTAIYIVRMSATGQTTPAMVFPMACGSWFQIYRSNWVFTVSTATVVSKGIFMTEYLPDGLYFLTYTITNSGGTGGTNGQFIIQQDGFNGPLLVNNTFPQVTGATPFFSGTEVVRLQQGSHALHIRYAAPSATATSIQNVIVSLMRYC